MNRTLIPLLALVAGCASHSQLQYDYARSFNQTLQIQSDLQRVTVAEDGYPLSGVEGVALRQQVIEKTTDEETGEAEYIASSRGREATMNLPRGSASTLR